jgi:hypothetical protein
MVIDAKKDEEKFISDDVPFKYQNENYILSTKILMKIILFWNNYSNFE